MTLMALMTGPTKGQPEPDADLMVETIVGYDPCDSTDCVAVRMTSRPNSDAAREVFLQDIGAGADAESFESISTYYINPVSKARSLRGAL